MSKERIIESLEYCRKNQKSNDCESCEYGGRSFQICERLVDDILVLLKEKKSLMLALALEQSNAANEYLNAEVERLNGLLKEQERTLNQLRSTMEDMVRGNASEEVSYLLRLMGKQEK